MAGPIAGLLAAHGLTIVSGLAYGIDAEAHRAALDAGGRTLAVLGQGLGTPLYPHTNARLGERIVKEERGALLSVFPLATGSNPGHFPLRNEIMAGLSLGTLVVEAALNSGTLITARHASAVDRVVMACPGDANRRSAQGSNRLIAEGAMLVQTAEDVLAALASELRREMAELPQADQVSATPGESDGEPIQALGRRTDSLDPVSKEILELLDAEPLHLDALIERCADKGFTHGDVLQRLL